MFEELSSSWFYNWVRQRTPAVFHWRGRYYFYGRQGVSASNSRLLPRIALNTLAARLLCLFGGLFG